MNEEVSSETLEEIEKILKKCDEISISRQDVSEYVGALNKEIREKIIEALLKNDKFFEKIFSDYYDDGRKSHVLIFRLIDWGFPEYTKAFLEKILGFEKTAKYVQDLDFMLNCKKHSPDYLERFKTLFKLHAMHDLLNNDKFFLDAIFCHGIVGFERFMYDVFPEDKDKLFERLFHFLQLTYTILTMFFAKGCFPEYKEKYESILKSELIPELLSNDESFIKFTNCSNAFGYLIDNLIDDEEVLCKKALTLPSVLILVISASSKKILSLLFKYSEDKKFLEYACELDKIVKSKDSTAVENMLASLRQELNKRVISHSTLQLLCSFLKELLKNYTSVKVESKFNTSLIQMYNELSALKIPPLSTLCIHSLIQNNIFEDALKCTLKMKSVKNVDEIEMIFEKEKENIKKEHKIILLKISSEDEWYIIGKSYTGMPVCGLIDRTAKLAQFLRSKENLDGEAEKKAGLEMATQYLGTHVPCNLLPHIQEMLAEKIQEATLLPKKM